MPSFKHVVEIDYIPTFRTQKVAGMFDVPVEGKLRKEWDINFPIEEREWQVGLIVGASGAGKTTLANKIFGEEAYFGGFDWQARSILDDFSKDLQIDDITGALSHVGFSSPPAWLLPYSALSNGQKFRADMARVLLEKDDLIVFDEFTSVVDRTVAKVGSHAVQKFVRKTNKKFVAVTCHYDVEETLQPDWVFDVSTGEFRWECLQRKPIEAKIFQCNYKAWQLFKGHHYLSAEINKASTVFVMEINGEPCAITALLPFPHPKKKNFWKEHRTVVLPDYQGMGLGNIMSEFSGEWLKGRGKGFTSVTSHPAMIAHRNNSDKWKMTRKPSRLAPPGTKAKVQSNKNTSISRLTASFEYRG